MLLMAGIRHTMRIIILILIQQQVVGYRADHK